MVWCDVFDLYAIGLAFATPRLAADDDAWGSATVCQHGPDLHGRWPVCGHEFDLAGSGFLAACYRNVVASLALAQDWVISGVR